MKLRKMRKQPGSGRVVINGIIRDTRPATGKAGGTREVRVRPKGRPVLKDGIWYFDYPIPTVEAIITEQQKLSLAKRLLAWFKRKAR